MTPRFTHAHHRRWLQQQPPARIVGRQADCYGCVMATYFNAVLLSHACWVGATTWYDSDDTRHVLPGWARRYVRALDQNELRDITAAQALAVLEALA